MKWKKEIILLILGFLLIISGILYSIIINNQGTSKLEKKNETVLVENSYHCELDEKQFEGEDKKLVTVNESYDFSYKNNEILYAGITTTYKFLDLDSYNHFVWSEENSSSSPNRVLENEESLEKQYKWIITIQKKQEEDDIKTYIKQLNNMGYTCKEK